MAIDAGSKFLSELVLTRTYAATKSDGYKETYDEVVERVLSHHKDKFPSLHLEIEKLRPFLLKKQIVPAMRWLQFAGEGIKRNNIRGFNCSFTTIQTFKDFAEIFYILMCGTGVGYSVQSRHVSKLPVIEEEAGLVHEISDDKEGWADAIYQLLMNPLTEFDYSKIRAAGVPLSTGGTASGPEALKVCIESARKILRAAVGRKLTSLEVHDIVCIIADAVVVGGVRRAALISLFDANDQEMASCKSGDWWVHSPHRARANISGVIHRQDITSAQLFEKLMKACYDSNSGEPGVVWTNNWDYGTNPCAEIALRSKQMCNLSEVNLAACKDFAEVVEAVQAATILGTLQASYTDFSYVSPRWKENCDEEALLGVSLTGLAEGWKLVENKYHLKYFAEVATSTNALWAEKLGINPSARITCVKPSGSASAFLGTTSGIHAAHAPYYIRRVRIDVSNPISKHLEKVLPANFLEKDLFNPSNYVVSIPMKAVGAIQRQEESAVGILERMKHISEWWIKPAHKSGNNTHNVSLTVSYKKDEESEVENWMWENRDEYAGVSLLPFSESVYQQAPFEEISEEKYKELIKLFPKLDLSSVNYLGKVDERGSEAACAGGSCELY